MTEIKGIIWDIGGVIYLSKDKKKLKEKNLHNSIKELFLLIKGINNKDNNLFKRFKEIYYQSSRGEISKYKTLKKLSIIFPSLNKKEIKQKITEAYQNNSIENKELSKFILGLTNKGYSQGLLSTQWALSYNSLNRKRLSKIFKKKVISYIDKKTKPSEEAFKLILRKMKLNPQEVIFIDDGKLNIGKAKELGMKGILFQNNTQLKKEFQKLGIE